MMIGILATTPAIAAPATVIDAVASRRGAGRRNERKKRESARETEVGWTPQSFSIILLLPQATSDNTRVLPLSKMCWLTTLLEDSRACPDTDCGDALGDFFLNLSLGNRH